MRRVRHKTKLNIVRLHRSGAKVCGVVKALEDMGVTASKHTVSYWIKQYLNGLFKPGDLEIPSTHSKIVSARDLKVVKKSLSVDSNQSSVDIHRELKSDGACFSRTTTRRIIKKVGFTSATPQYAQMVSNRNKPLRVNFCKTLIIDNDNMNDMIFTDETSVQLHNNKKPCYREIGQINPTIPKPKHALNVHVWGGISRRGQTPILIFEGIMEKTFFTNNILRDTLLPHVQEVFPDGHRLQQDNNPKHRSIMAREFMTANGINHWKIWPSESPDLNPIEMVWNQLKCYVAKKEPMTKDTLVQCIKEFWNTQMTVEQCNCYIDHVFKVAPVCVLMEGEATGNVPNKLFTDRSRGKSFKYYNDLLLTDAMKVKIDTLNV